MKAYKFRLYPNKEQKILLNKNFGCVRFVYNKILFLVEKTKELGWCKIKTQNGTTVNKKGKTVNTYDVKIVRLSKDEIEQLKNSGIKIEFFNPMDFQYLISIWKKGNKYSWLKEVNSVALIFARENLDTAYKNFFNNIKKGIKKGYPKPKNKFKYNSIQDHQSNYIDVKRGTFGMGKIKDIKCIYHRPMPVGEVKTCTISKETDGKFFVSILISPDNPVVIPDKTDVFNTDNSVGLDLGVINIATTSDGVKYPNPRLINKFQEKIAYYQSILALKKGSNKGEEKSKNYRKIKDKINKLYAKLCRCREYNQYKIVHGVIKNKDNVFYHDLDIKNMLSKPEAIQKEDGSYEHNGAKLKAKFNKSLSDASLGGLIVKLKNKCDEYGKNCIPIREQNISKTCNVCSHVNNITNTAESYICQGCGINLDGDINTAKNILEVGLNIKK